MAYQTRSQDDWLSLLYLETKPNFETGLKTTSSFFFFFSFFPRQVRGFPFSEA